MLKKANKNIGYILLIVGFILIVIGVKDIIKRNTPVNFVTEKTQNINNIQNIVATSIVITSLKIYLPIIEASILNGKWENPQNKVAHWNKSPIAGEKGNSVLYGHNWPVVFEKLKNIKKDSIIIINYNNGASKTFKVDSVYIVTKDQTHILNNTEDTRLTIYTCTGFLDSKRLVVIATPSL